MKRIKSQEDLEKWKLSPAFGELNEFLDKMFGEIRGKKISEIPIETNCKSLNGIVDLLDQVGEAVNSINPDITGEPDRRYGSKTFRKLIAKIEEILEENQLNGTFLGKVFMNSFGDPIRIDYGTGHELAFIIFVHCTIKKAESETDYAWIGGHLIGQKYLTLVRKIQCKYSLEPAGSHGVWGLDDHQFIPFLLGSCQLIGIEGKVNCDPLLPGELIKHQNFSNPLIRSEYLYPAALNHTHHLKTRTNPSVQFHNHSPLLYDISGVASWLKIHEGLRRMYEKEVLSKLPVVQHILFEPNLFEFDPSI